MTDMALRITALGIFICWTFYWLITERKADREKPKIRKLSFFQKNNLRKLFLRFAELILVLQLLGLPLFQIPNARVSMQLLGFVLVVIGVSISISARRTLGTNWAHAFEYQVKQKQELVTGGIYSYIRHPIYTGLILAFVGGELVARSYLVILGLVFVLGAYYQAKLEEKLLTEHFGDKYKTYMKNTKMLLPFLW